MNEFLIIFIIFAGSGLIKLDICLKACFYRVSHFNFIKDEIL